MADEDEFSHLKARITEVKSLTSKYKNHRYVKDFMKDWKVMFSYGTYLLEGEIDPNFSSSKIWSLIQEDSNNKVIQRRFVNLISAVEYLQLQPDLTPEKLKRVHTMIMQQEKNMLIGEYRKTPAFAGFTMFAPASAIEKLIKEGLQRCYDDDPISAATKLFAELINIHPFEDGNGRLCRVILSHLLMQSGCSLFSVLLSSFHKRDRKHYIRAVQRY